MSGNNAVNGGGDSQHRHAHRPSNTTFEYNFANGGNGGGLYNTGTASLQKYDLLITMSRRAVAGIDNEGGTLNMLNSTIAQNSIGSGGGSAALNGSGGSVLNFTTSTRTAVKGARLSSSTGGSVTAKNSIIAANTGGNCSGSLDGRWRQTSMTIARAAASPVRKIWSSVDSAITAAVLKPSLSTRPAMPLTPTDCMTTSGAVVGDDQRGITRPQNWIGQTAPGFCDAGSYEVEEGTQGGG